MLTRKKNVIQYVECNNMYGMFPGKHHHMMYVRRDTKDNRS